MGFNGDGAVQGGMSGAAAGSAFGPWGAAIGGVGGAVYGGLQKKKGIDYSYLDNLYAQRKARIGDFQSQLNAARRRYLTSVGSMYDQSYGRFSQNAEAGFAGRGLAVNGGSFASALAKKTADYQAQLEPMAYNAEREDLASVNNAYDAADNMYAAGRSGGPMTEYTANREDSSSFGRALGNFTQLASTWKKSGGSNSFWSGENGTAPSGNMKYTSSGSGRVGRGRLDLWGV